MDTKGLGCIPKWLGEVAAGEVAIVNVRPDGYVGSIRRWDIASQAAGEAAAHWLDEYYGGFLEVHSASNEAVRPSTRNLHLSCRERIF
jgi:hypothetical protein